MCRLYGSRSSHPTEVECGLLDAQNALIRQSEEDARGLVNDDGWGIGFVYRGELHCEREVGPASESQEFREDAADVEATTVVAHVRRATVGHAAVENTHPFRHGRSMLVHNGHVGGFDEIRGHMLSEMTAEHRRAIAGTTDSEHVFHLLLSRLDGSPGAGMAEVLRDTARDVVRWSKEAAPDEEVALNLVWTVDEEMVATRLGRSLWARERDGPLMCESCGERHPDPGTVPEDEAYRAVVLASERITGEGWDEVPDGSLLRVTEDLRLEVDPLPL